MCLANFDKPWEPFKFVIGLDWRLPTFLCHQLGSFRVFQGTQITLKTSLITFWMFGMPRVSQKLVHNIWYWKTRTPDFQYISWGHSSDAIGFCFNGTICFSGFSRQDQNSSHIFKLKSMKHLQLMLDLLMCQRSWQWPIFAGKFLLS